MTGRGFELPELDILQAVPGEFWPVLLAVVIVGPIVWLAARLTVRQGQRAEVVR